MSVSAAMQLRPVCGCTLDFMPWRGLSAADEICPCCGIQFGCDDAAGGDVSKRQDIYEKWRQGWIDAGMPWKSKGKGPSFDWDSFAQLARIQSR